jgi:hypothetical protein
VLFILPGCKNKEQPPMPKKGENNLIEIQLSDSHDYKHELKLSDIANDVSYIPLETNKNCLISDDIGKIKSTKDYIFIESNGILLQFDRQGKFIRQVNKKGQGPDECEVRVYDIDEKSQLIYILDNWKLDTIFKINDDYTCSESWIIKLPNKIILEEDVKINCKTLDISSLSKKNTFNAIREDAQYAYIYHTYNPFSMDNKKILSRYEKQSGQLMENINPKIENDWDGGMDIQLSPYSQNENGVCILLQPFEMKEILTNSHFSEVQAKYPERQKALQILVNKLKEDDNPVLMFIQL